MAAKSPKPGSRKSKILRPNFFIPFAAIGAFHVGNTLTTRQPFWLKVAHGCKTASLGCGGMASTAKTITLTIRGSADEITRLLGNLDLQSTDQSSSNEGGQPPTVSVMIPGPARCRAIKKCGVRCKLTAARVGLEDGLCPYHRQWPTLGREVLPE